MKYQEWLFNVPEEITEDSVWNLKVYRAALYISDLGWYDTNKILDKRFYSLADQLYSATGSISANITEGYSRNSLKEKARFYEIALESARESKDWYYKSRHILDEVCSINRMKILTSIIKLLLTMINEKRNSHQVSEPEIDYNANNLEKILTDLSNS